jgi:hypothetical protein
MRRTLAFASFALVCSVTVASAVTLDWAKHDKWQIRCEFNEWCKLGEQCVKDSLLMKLVYSPVKGTATHDLGHRKRVAKAFGDKGRPGSRARSFLFPLDQGATGLLTLFHSGGAIYSIQYEGSPAGGQTRRGGCRAEPADEVLR